MANGHGGARKGAGRKKKSLQEKMLDGNPSKRKHKVLDIPPNVMAPKEMPEYLDEFPAYDMDYTISGIYEQTVDWLENTGCLHLINPALIAEYCILKTRWLECEWKVAEGLILFTSNDYYVNPFPDIGLKYLKSANEVWEKIDAVVQQNSVKMVGVSPNESIMMSLLSFGDGRRE